MYFNDKCEYRIEQLDCHKYIANAYSQALNQAIEQLPANYRTVFVLHDIVGRKHPEIAKLLGYSIETSKAYLHKARMTIRDLLVIEQV